ncbi:hypothetical protein IWZ00DRAFT_322644 [Phyllosticta capitalensis]
MDEKRGERRTREERDRVAPTGCPGVPLVECLLACSVACPPACFALLPSTYLPNVYLACSVACSVDTSDRAFASHSTATAIPSIALKTPLLAALKSAAGAHRQQACWSPTPVEHVGGGDCPMCLPSVSLPSRITPWRAWRCACNLEEVRGLIGAVSIAVAPVAVYLRRQLAPCRLGSGESHTRTLRANQPATGFHGLKADGEVRQCLGII